MRSARFLPVAILLLTGAVVAAVIHCIHYGQLVDVDMYQAYRVYARYVDDHDGVLPEQLDDLVNERYFHTAQDEQSEYFLEPPYEGDWYTPAFPGRPIRHLREFTFLFGGSLADLELRGTRVHSKKANTEVLFVSHWFPGLRPGARHLTKRRFEELTCRQQQREPSLPNQRGGRGGSEPQPPNTEP